MHKIDHQVCKRPGIHIARGYSLEGQSVFLKSCSQNSYCALVYVKIVSVEYIKVKIVVIRAVGHQNGL